jgi:Spy/CpxP family protein refolding chaperone
MAFLSTSAEGSEHKYSRINRTRRGLKMDLSQIVSELKKEKNRIDKAIAALNGTEGHRAAKASNVKSVARTPQRRGHLTPEGRKRLSEIMKKRWAERRKRGARGRKAA